MSTAIPEHSLALVAYAPVSIEPWRLESVIPRRIRDDEVLVRMIATGICAADVHFGDMVVDKSVGDSAMSFPRILGHEGSGYVEEIGRSVTRVKPGDPVLLSYLSCGRCHNCADQHPAYCVEMFDCNWRGESGMYATRGSEDLGITGSFFGQSSFASKAIVKERSVVNVAGLNVTEDELEILAPLGCGVQTGSGAFINLANVQAEHQVAVLGVGGVGQSAVMAAVMRRCRTIIAIDRSSSRLQLARELGATHTIDTSVSTVDLVAEVMKITNGEGVNVSLDTTGVQTLARQSWEFTGRRGKILQVGLAKPEDMWNISMADHMNSGKQILGCVEGDAVPEKYILEMISWYRAGKLPVDRIISKYPVANHEQALKDMRIGKAIKPTLKMHYRSLIIYSLPDVVGGHLHGKPIGSDKDDEDEDGDDDDEYDGAEDTEELNGLQKKSEVETSADDVD